tara:strand:+ start:4666 stop:5910 length:1245 start_codon:yes stop_codon:yes gene_type:complete
MANEIKFVFVGDTADFDKAIDSIVKKTNKIKDVDKDANKVRKQAVNLEKVLASEYDKARKNAGSLTDITKKLAREEAKRLEINKKLSSETLSQSRRQSLLVERSKSQARTSGLKGAGVAGMGKLAAGTIVAALATGITAAVKGTLSAIGEAEAIRGGALGAGKTIEQFQTEQFAASIHRSPKEVGEAINSLGLIIDKDLIKRLTESGDKLKTVSQILKNKLIPAFTFLAEKMATFGVSLAATVQTIQEIGWKEIFFPSQLGAGSVQKMPTDKQIHDRIYDNFRASGQNPTSAQFGAGMAMMNRSTFGWQEKPDFKRAQDELIDQFKKANPTEFEKIFKKNEAALNKQMEALLGGSVMKPQQEATSMRGFSDSLARIGLFKSGRDSQLQTMKASLAVQKGIQTNTTGLKDVIFNA